MLSTRRVTKFHLKFPFCFNIIIALPSHQGALPYPTKHDKSARKRHLYSKIPNRYSSSSAISFPGRHETLIRHGESATSPTAPRRSNQKQWPVHPRDHTMTTSSKEHKPQTTRLLQAPASLSPTRASNTRPAGNPSNPPPAHDSVTLPRNNAGQENSAHQKLCLATTPYSSSSLSSYIAGSPTTAVAGISNS